MTNLTRRRFLGASAAAGTAAASLALLPPSVQKALANAPKRAPRVADIEHVVMLMQENRSFDHYFGTLSGVAGFDDPHAITLPSGRSVFHQPDRAHPHGFVLPFHLDTTRTNAQAIASTNHSWSVQHDSWNHGAMDRWIPAHRNANKERAPFVMGYYTRADLPFQYALADAFTICDHYHSSVIGPTWPNRMYWMTGTIDPQGEHNGPIIHDTVPPEGYRWRTYAERLEAAGVSWHVYQEEDNFNANMLSYFTRFQDAKRSSRLHQHGMRTSERGQFEYDARHDRLPAVSWIIPTTRQCEHPDHLPAEGANFIASKIAAIASNPGVWNKTVFILDYDENDGFFDHVRPPTPRHGTPGEFIDGLPIGGGFRVPCLVVSPWTAGGWVASEHFDHTSVLQFLERFTGVGEPNISKWRRRTFGDLTSVFRFGQPRTDPPPLPRTYAHLERVWHGVKTLPDPKLPHAAQRMPHQERGGRRNTSHPPRNHGEALTY